MEQENDGTIVTLVDEEGKEQEYEHLASLEYEGSTYIALSPCISDPDEYIESSGDLVILRSDEDENGEIVLSSIEDEQEFEAVAEQFEQLLEEEYDIVDDEYEDEDDEDDEDEEDD